MKKIIYMTMTNERARQFGYTPRGDLAHAPVDIDLDALSPLARWIAEHITATRVYDEVRDVIPVYAVAGFSMAERDRRAGRSDKYIASMTRCYERLYTDPMRTDISFPIYGRGQKRPEDVIEVTARELTQNGAVCLVDRLTGEECAIG